MSPRVYIYVCGLFTVPGEVHNWTGRAVTWTHLQGADRAEKFEYFTGALGRSLGQDDRAAKLAKMLGFYLAHSWRIVLVAHSNGADVCLDALRTLGYPVVERLHLLSPACSADCEHSGLNRVLADGVMVYRAGRDWTMHWAGSGVGQMLGFGDLGKDGPQNYRNALAPIEVFDEPDYGHSAWFDAGTRFELTMQRTR